MRTSSRARKKFKAVSMARVPTLRGQPSLEKVRTVVVHHHHLHRPKVEMTSTGNSPWSYPFAAYEALANSDDRSQITTAGLGMMLTSAWRWLPAPVINFQRLRLAAISKYLYDNSGVVSYGIDTIANYSTPIVPRAATSDPDLNKEYEAYFASWSKRADYTGRFNFAKIQQLASKAIDLAGDQAFLMTSENGFPQIQTIEAWQIGSLRVRPNIRIIDGNILTDSGAVTGYVVQTKDGETDISANQMLLLYDPDYYLDYRGITPIRRGSNDVRDGVDLKAFEKKGAKLNSALSGYIEGGPVVDDDWGNATGNSDHPGSAPADGVNTDGTEATKNQLGLTFADLMGGDIPVLPAGQSIKLLDNKRPGSQTIEFLEALEGYFVAGIGLPATFISDKKLTGPNIRAVIGKAQKKFYKRQDVISLLVEWAWPRVMADAITRKEVPPSPEFGKIVFQYPAKFSIDLGDQAANDREDVATGQMTRRERWGNRSMDWQEEEDQLEREFDYILKKAARQAKEYNVPIDTALAFYGVGTQSKVAASNNIGQQPGTPLPDGTK